MKIPLSPRLQACCNFIAPGDRVADVGTDHGYLGLWLLQQGIARSVIASDIGEGPLSDARSNALRYGFANKMEFCLSDGLQQVPRDFDVVVCAGMGAETIISILSQADWLKTGDYRLVLQCQTKTHLLRRYLSEQGWRITEETVIRDGRFLYTVMEVIWQPGYSLSPGQWYFPPALLENPSNDVPEYYRWILAQLQKIVRGRGESAHPELIAALEELERDPMLQCFKEDTL